MLSANAAPRSSARLAQHNCVWGHVQRIWAHVRTYLAPCAVASASRFERICSRSRTKIGIKQAKLQGTNIKMDCKSINYQAFVYFYIDYNQKNT